MPDGMEATLLDRAREAASKGNWHAAYELLLEADARCPLAAPDLAFLGGVAYAAGHVDATIEAWERAHHAAVEAGDDLAAAAAAVRVALHLLMDTALLAPMRGWLARAERYLSNREETPVHAWVAIGRSYDRFLSGDFASARQQAARAIAIGTRCDRVAATVGRVAEARSRILMGEVEEGLETFNEAAVAMLSGEIDPISVGMVYCEVVCAFQALGQYDLAEEWTDAMERWRQGQSVGSMHGRCRLHRAEILRLRGKCAEAETEILAACDELRPYLRREFGWPLTELGRIRLRRGDVDGAEAAFLAAHQAGWDPQPGLALVHLARGDIARASASIRDALERPSTVPSKEWPQNSDLRRAPLLEAQAEIEAVAGDIDQARSAADELALVAVRFHSKALAASASLAQGRAHFAAGDLAAAGRAFATATQQWGDIGAPYETSVARTNLAHVLRAEGNEERASLELRAARSTFAAIGAVAREARVIDDSGAPAVKSRSTAEQPADFRREGDYWSIVFDGRTVRVRHSKGMQYLARLLGEAGRELHVMDLVSAASEIGGDPTMRVDTGDAGELLDARAKEAYRRRLTEIEEDLEEARALGDARRAAQADAERDFLLKELARAVGLGGRDRRAGAASERARSAVTRAIRQALLRIRAHDGAIAEYLDRSIRTGAYCVYLPDPRTRVVWKF